MDERLDDRAVRTLTCPYCGAVPEQWCVTVNGLRATAVHAARWAPIAEAYSAGYLDGEAAHG